MSLVGVYVGLALTCLTSAQVAAQTSETLAGTAPAVTTWAVRIAPGSRCAENQAFANTVSAQIPNANRASAESAELVAEVNLLESGLARIMVFDRVLLAQAGSRELQLDSRSCDDSAEAVALVLAVLVEAGRGSLSAASPPVQLEPPGAPPPATPLPPPPSPRQSEPRHLWLGPRAGHDLSASVGVSFGLLPSPAWAGTIGWGIRGTKTWPIWIQVTGLHKRADTDSEIGARFSAIYAEVLGCPLTPSWGSLRGRACAGAGVGALSAESVGLKANSAQTKALYVLGLELAGNVRLVGPLEFTTMFRVDVYPEPYRFFYTGPTGRTSLHKVKPVSASLLAGLALRFR